MCRRGVYGSMLLAHHAVTTYGNGGGGAHTILNSSRWMRLRVMQLHDRDHPKFLKFSLFFFVSCLFFAAVRHTRQTERTRSCGAKRHKSVTSCRVCACVRACGVRFVGKRGDGEEKVWYSIYDLSIRGTEITHLLAARMSACVPARNCYSVHPHNQPQQQTNA